MRVFPASPRDRVAVGTALVTAGVVLFVVAPIPAGAFIAGLCIGVGLTMVVTGLLRLRAAARLRHPGR